MLSRDEVKGDPIGPTPITMALQQIIMAISYLGKVTLVFLIWSLHFIYERHF